MTDVIHLLPDSVANQIAAGEVIQRPASVVKELVENAIDAGARQIIVLITDAGRTCIQVIDDGQGMSETDARLSFERHATSKICKADDLYALHTMGFRGEALASIAAVAQVELRTRRAEEETGTRILLEGSQLIRQEPVSCPVGSNFAVRNLFFNVPVRRKFLKSNTTELTNIITEFERIVLVNPAIAFTLRANEGEIFNLPAVTGVRARILSVFGKKLNQQLLPVEVETSMVKISGFVGKPDAARKKTEQFFFVNGRYMRHPYFYKALTDAYEHLIVAGEQIPFFLYLEVPPADIDVNIHPTKTEIKFENEHAIWQILSAAIKETLSKFNAVPSLDFDTIDRPDIPVFGETPSLEMPKVHVNTGYNPFQKPY
ncbi:MAG: DNA mismatch repair endonuclease MutL, partial [Prevotellaceae bacterium]|nr:DNA mismatch repair endonuclease MutL [Prevotellaceae bacterium]